MEKSHWLLIGGTVIVVIVIIAVFMTGMGTSVQSSRPGYGQGQPAGVSLGQGAGPVRLARLSSPGRTQPP